MVGSFVVCWTLLQVFKVNAQKDHGKFCNLLNKKIVTSFYVAFQVLQFVEHCYKFCVAFISMVDKKIIASFTVCWTKKIVACFQGIFTKRSWKNE